MKVVWSCVFVFCVHHTAPPKAPIKGVRILVLDITCVTLCVGFTLVGPSSRGSWSVVFRVWTLHTNEVLRRTEYHSLALGFVCVCAEVIVYLKLLYSTNTLHGYRALALTPTPTPTRWAYDTARIWSSTACFGDGGLVGRHGFVHLRMLTQQGCIHELHPQHAWPRKAVVETIDLVPIWSHACWYLDVKQCKAQWAKCLPSQGVALFILTPVVCAARIQKRCVGFRC